MGLFEKLACGNISLRPFIVVDGEKIFPENTSWSNLKNEYRCSCTYVDGIADDFYFSVDRKNGDIKCTRNFTNGSKTLKLNEIGFELCGISFGAEPAQDYFYHNENPRIYARMTFPVDYNRSVSDAQDSEFDATAGNRWADPGVVGERIGRSPYQPFPAIHLGNYSHKHGLVHGTLSQQVFYHNYLVSHENGEVKLDVLSSFKALEYMETAPGRILRDIWYLGATDNADDIELVFAGYTRVLRKVLPTSYGRTDINRDNMVWGSWNDGIFRDVSEDMLLKEARFLKANFPTVRWIQLDDGYATTVPPANGISVPYDDSMDYKKFPKGLRHYTDGIREIGLRPALWIGGFCSHDTAVYREHPEWFIDYSMRVNSSSPLDVSQAEVRKYMEYALDVLVSKGGFDAVKHDFWSYAFEDSHDLLSVKDKSGYEHRTWWLRELRKHIAPDGYLQTGCDIVMGNPFLGEYFTNYRYGIDIGCGNWDYVKINFMWGAACFATHTGDMFVPNSDSIGLFPGLNDIDAMYALNYCVVSRSMVEIAGKLSENPDHPRMRYLKKAACCVNNGQDVYFANYDYRKDADENNVPLLMYLRSAQFSALIDNDCMPVRTVGVFNSQDTDAVIGFSKADLKLDEAKRFRIYNIWSGEFLDFDPANRIEFQLKGHESLLLALYDAGTKAMLVDANVKVVSAERAGDALLMSFDYDYPDAELRFASAPVKVIADGADVPYKADGNIVSMSVEKSVEYQFVF